MSLGSGRYNRGPARRSLPKPRLNPNSTWSEEFLIRIAMGRTKTLALWAILCCGSLSGAAEVDSFTIRSAAAVGRIEARFFLAGAFGGYGGFVRDSHEDGAYRIPLEQDGRMGTNLKAILFGRVCQFTILFQWICSPIQHGTATFSCQPLSSITLAGRISAARSSTRALDVEVRYLFIMGSYTLRL